MTHSQTVMAEMKNKGYDVSSVKLDVNSCDCATFFQEGMGTFYEMREGLKKYKWKKLQGTLEVC